MLNKISIITPTYNSDKYIEDCINSVANIDKFSIEHIIIDNLSQDNTSNIVNSLIIKYANKKNYTIKYINEHDIGQSDAINKGINLSSGDFIGWLNADEFYNKQGLEILLSKIDKDDQVVYCNSSFVDSDKKLLKRKCEYIFSMNMLKYYGCYIPSCATFIKTSIAKNFPLDVNLRISMDWDLYLNLSTNGIKFRYIDLNVGNFILTGNNISHNNPKRKKVELQIISQKYNIYTWNKIRLSNIQRIIFSTYWRVFRTLHKYLIK